VCVCVCVCVHVCGATSSQGSAATPSTEGKQDGNAEISVCKTRAIDVSVRGDECEAVCKRLCVRGKNVRMYIAM